MADETTGTLLRVALRYLAIHNFDESKKVHILRFLHTHSHYGEVGEPEHDLSVLSEAQEVLKDLLDLIKSEDEKHFRAMESLVPTTNLSEDNNKQVQ